MRVKISKKRFKQIFREEREFFKRNGRSFTKCDLVEALRQRGYLIKESELTANDAKSDSLDAQVDRYLSGIESSSRIKAESAWRDDVRRFLSEAEGDKEKKGDDEQDDPTQKKLPLEVIDVEEFANGVSRLIENYDSLLEVRSTLVRRAKTFLDKNYDQDVLESFEDIMRGEHSIVPGMTQRELEDDEFSPPRAGQAGPGGGA